MTSKLLATQQCMAILVTLTALSATAPAADEVTRRSDGTTFRGTIENETTESVTVVAGNRSTVISVADLKRVRFDGEPSALNQARISEASGALEKALERYRAVEADYSGSDSRLTRDLKFLIARTLAKSALVNPAQMPEAVAALEQFRTSNTSNFRYLEATLWLAELRAHSDDSTDAKSLLQELQNSNVDGFKLQASVQLGHLLLAEGDAAGAQSAFESVLQQVGNKPEEAAVRFSAQIGRALSEKQAGQVDAALTTLDEIVRNAPLSETDILAEAWLRRGDCFRQQGKDKDALYAYLHVDVLYSADVSRHAESLYWLAQLWPAAGYQERGDEAAGRLNGQYPASQWAEKLRNGG